MLVGILRVPMIPFDLLLPDLRVLLVPHAFLLGMEEELLGLLALGLLALILLLLVVIGLVVVLFLIILFFLFFFLLLLLVILNVLANIAAQLFHFIFKIKHLILDPSNVICHDTDVFQHRLLLLSVPPSSCPP